MPESIVAEPKNPPTPFSDFASDVGWRLYALMYQARATLALLEQPEYPLGTDDERTGISYMLQTIEKAAETLAGEVNGVAYDYIAAPEREAGHV